MSTQYIMNKVVGGLVASVIGLLRHYYMEEKSKKRGMMLFLTRFNSCRYKSDYGYVKVQVKVLEVASCSGLHST